MKRLLLSLFLIVSIILTSTGVVFASAAVKITEVPDIKIIMEGKLTKYTDVPLMIQGRTMLPLRELLVNLGVPNDDEHIIWNNQEKSVTVIKGDTRIYLAEGNKTAYVNDESFELDVAPIIYKMRTYIPLRFVAEALDMKVVWEGKSQAVFLCDSAKYESIKEILQKYDEAMQKTQSFKQIAAGKTTIENKKGSLKFDVTEETQVDKGQKKLYSKGKYDFLGMNIEQEEYLSENVLYFWSNFSGKWEKRTYGQKRYEEVFNEDCNELVVVSDEVLYAGLNQVPSDNPDEILLKGDACLTGLMTMLTEEEALMLPVDKMVYKTYNVEISLDSKTFLANRIIMNMTAQMPSDEGLSDCSSSIRMEYSDYDGDFTIEVPEDVVKSAVESELAD